MKLASVSNMAICGQVLLLIGLLMILPDVADGQTLTLYWENTNTEYNFSLPLNSGLGCTVRIPRGQ